MNKGIRFTDEFKQDAVAQVVERGYSVSDITDRLDYFENFGWTIKAFAEHVRKRFT